MEDFGKGLEDLGRSLEVKTGGSNPETSKTRIFLFNRKFPYFPFLSVIATQLDAQDGHCCAVESDPCGPLNGFKRFF